jgi:hypothetical protein
MNLLFRVLSGMLLCCLATIASAENYGAAITTKNPLSLEAAIQELDDKLTADVLVESKVAAVCVVKGCWMALTSSQNEVRVTFKNYGFFVPSSVIGKTVVVEGTLEKVVMSLEDTKHYVKDAGGDPSQVTHPRTEYRIVASGVAVKS